jgi:hypothetical protein
MGRNLPLVVIERLHAQVHSQTSQVCDFLTAASTYVTHLTGA